MLPQTFNPALYHWLIRPRKIEWCITMGFNARRKPNIIGTLVTSLAYIDDQGDKWGDTYVKIVGQHYEDYAHWSSKCILFPIGGTPTSRIFVPSTFKQRKYKDAAPGITGLIGEVLTTIFLQNIIRIDPFDMAHIIGDNKAPDFCLDIEPRMLGNLFRTATHKRSKLENEAIADYLDSITWNKPLPLECKAEGERETGRYAKQCSRYWNIGGMFPKWLVMVYLHRLMLILIQKFDYMYCYLSQRKMII